MAYVRSTRKFCSGLHLNSKERSGEGRNEYLSAERKEVEKVPGRGRKHAAMVTQAGMACQLKK